MLPVLKDDRRVRGKSRCHLDVLMTVTILFQATEAYNPQHLAICLQAHAQDRLQRAPLKSLIRNEVTCKGQNARVKALARFAAAHHFSEDTFAERNSSLKNRRDMRPEFENRLEDV